MPGVIKSIIDTNSTTNSDSDVFNSPVSGNYLKAKVKGFSIPTVLLLFYFDEVEVCNPLGSRHGTHKLGNCYF